MVNRKDKSKSLESAINDLKSNPSGLEPIFDPERAVKSLSLSATHYAEQADKAVQFLSSPPVLDALNIANVIASKLRNISLVINTALATNKQDIDQFITLLSKLASIDWSPIIQRNYEAVMFAASRGWFIQPEFDLPQIIALSGTATEEDSKTLDKNFSNAIENYEIAIMKRLLDDYKDRTHLINEAFQLHEEGRYYAAIPLFLMLAEGIGYGKTTFSVFSTKRNKPEVAKYFNTVKLQSNSINDMFSRPLAENHPLSRNMKGKLNRHKVLHGRDISYGTKINSLQAISFLGNAGWVFSLENDELTGNLVPDKE